jgi:peptidyl-prolyl cis-trans isomerase B (cyclophilin B)
MHKDAPHLDGQYAAFGKVTEGMEVVDEIAETKTESGDRPVKKQVITKASVDTFGESYPQPATIKKF